MVSEDITVIGTYTAKVNYKTKIKWKCKDRRYLIRPKDKSKGLADSYESICRWDTSFSKSPQSLECILTYCDNPVNDPNSNGANYNFAWGGNRIGLGKTIYYPCKTGHRVESDTNWKNESDSGTHITCGQDGEFVYPDPWPQCSSTVQCADPGNSDGITRTQTTSKSEFDYDSVYKYECDDPRKWIKISGSADSTLKASLSTRCNWRKTFPLDGNNLECVIHHCMHPHDDPGGHEAPDSSLKISLKDETDWQIAFGGNVTYECEAGTHIENDEIDPTQTFIQVFCLQDVGEYDTPVRQGGSWPNCTLTVVCGLPPEAPVNGTRTWISPALNSQMTYDTSIIYQCPDGTAFDVDDDGLGDNVTVTIRCQWNKDWFPFKVLPPCIVTHCIEPFKIPDESNLEELTSDWTPINTNKQYQCKNTVDSVYTMFWETDRSKSTFELFCKDDGYFTWEDWPTCLTDITCAPDPPVIPTNPEYTLSKDDGTVTVNSLQYPVYPTENRVENMILNSTENNTLLAKNYMANLTYHCGSAREFFYEDGTQAVTQSMTCQWDKTWTPTTELGTCDWVACLKPPTPPAHTHLFVNNWFGDTIAFGDQISFVCERGYKFEEDPQQYDVKYTCQDGSNEEYKELKGFFDVPEKEEDWPRCVLGPLCPKPPDTPDEGIKDHVPIPIKIDPEETCELNGEEVTLTCYSFLNIYISHVVYSRDKGYELCNGTKPPDFAKPTNDASCSDDNVNKQIKEELEYYCHADYSCTYSIPTLLIGANCDGMKRELRTKHHCGKNLKKLILIF